jgi:hypothetical protein
MTMTKFLSVLVVAAAVAMFTVNCGGGADTPAGIENMMYSQFQKGNYEKAVEILVDHIDSKKAPSDEEKKMTMVALTEKTKQSLDAKQGVKSYEVVKEEISEDGESATVETKVVYGDGSESTEKTKYVRKEGAWKIVFGL